MTHGQRLEAAQADVRRTYHGGWVGPLVAAVVWLAARLAAVGDISIGELVAVYGYAAVMIAPVTFFIEGATDFSQAMVPARRVIRFPRARERCCTLQGQEAHEL